MKTTVARNIDEFISAFPAAVARKLTQLRRAVQRIAPAAEETICYGIPTFRLNGNILHFAAYPTHIGFYPGPGGIDAFAEDCVPYRTGKGTLQFRLDKPLPMALLRNIIKFRVMQQELKVGKKVIVCKNGHRFTRTGSCRTCPTCAQEAKKSDGYPAALAAPARRALAAAGIHNPADLKDWSEKDLLELHGVGQNAIKVLRSWNVGGRKRKSTS